MTKQNEKRIKQKTIAFKPSDIERLEAEARAAQVSLAVYIRECALGRKPKARPKAIKNEAREKLMLAISKIIVNYGQIWGHLAENERAGVNHTYRQLLHVYHVRADNGDFNTDVALEAVQRLNDIGQTINEQAYLANNGKPFEKEHLWKAGEELKAVITEVFPPRCEG